MTEREARKTVRKHWAEFILNADGPPPGTDAVWASENERIARRLGFERGVICGEQLPQVKK